MDLTLLVAGLVAAIAGNTTPQGKPWVRGVRIGFYVTATILILVFLLRWLNVTVRVYR